MKSTSFKVGDILACKTNDHFYLILDGGVDESMRYVTEDGYCGYMNRYENFTRLDTISLNLLEKFETALTTLNSQEPNSQRLDNLTYIEVLDKLRDYEIQRPSKSV